LPIEKASVLLRNLQEAERVSCERDVAQFLNISTLHVVRKVQKKHVQFEFVKVKQSLATRVSSAPNQLLL